MVYRVAFGARKVCGARNTGVPMGERRNPLGIMMDQGMMIGKGLVEWIQKTNDSTVQ